ncbi:MAG: hypothetical protein ACR2LX_12240 [Jatrophihabitans sp.]
MRERWFKFDPRLRTTIPDAPSFIRRGTSGGWRSELPLATQVRIEKDLLETASQMGDPALAAAFAPIVVP